MTSIEIRRGGSRGDGIFGMRTNSLVATGVQRELRNRVMAVSRSCYAALVFSRLNDSAVMSSHRRGDNLVTTWSQWYKTAEEQSEETCSCKVQSMQQHTHTFSPSSRYHLDRVALAILLDPQPLHFFTLYFTKLLATTLRLQCHNCAFGHTARHASNYKN